MLEIKKDSGIGFCFGVRRAIDIVEKITHECGTVETLGAIVHNQPVLQKLAGIGVRIAGGVDDIKGDIVVTSAHGISPRMEEELRARNIDIVSTTCPFVHRAQLAAQRLAQAGFRVVIYGDANHPEVEGVIGWAKGNAVATLDEKFVYGIKPLPGRLGVLSQTTQIPAHFTDFVKKLVNLTFTKDSELCVIDTICHEIRERQASALELAGSVDLMLVIGGHNSANTNCLVRLCSRVTRAYLIETADEIDSSWFRGQRCVGITGGTSAAEETINDVVVRLESIA